MILLVYIMFSEKRVLLKWAEGVQVNLYGF